MEYKKRVEKIKTEEELEKIALDEIKELKKKVFLEYEKERDAMEELKEKRQNEDKLFIEEQDRELKKFNYILEMSDGSFEVVSKEDVEIATKKDLTECKDCEF